ncbi:hypothetical protein GK047_10765 [Paenibacillus sp. SYP-B3998]|uniref:Uncharacterized protein n=1 Tax=Paenibacillus sp. SYP-B3998 TaxID=2678564 RepID=A0A6G3ZWI4_9BACL|nr:hypothetical protein [Paenibacillus sp. SYP-B3998]NEW06492.1 hypothetical protein [Paenibacillus sp. SYP-B3998]
MHRFVRSEKGVVSVYLILIIVPIFLFQAVLIDFARIKLAEKETDSAVKAATRSVMSAFDMELQAMGLYGLGLTQENKESIFREVFADNVSGHVTPGGFHYIDTKPELRDLRVTPVYSLANHVIFEKQVLEDMKIKAPIEFMLEITDKFRKSGTTVPFEQGSLFAKEASELDKLLNQREEALDEAWQSTEELFAKTKAYHDHYQKRISELGDLMTQIGSHTMNEVRSSLDQVKDQLRSIREAMANLDSNLASLSQAGPPNWASIQPILQSKQALGEQAQALVEKQNELEKLLELLIKYAALLTTTKIEALANGKVIGELLHRIEPELRKAKQKNDEIRQKLNGIAQNASVDKSKASDAFLSVVVIGDDYFYKYQTSIASIVALFSVFQEIVDSVILYTTDNKTKANNGNEAYWTQSSTFYANQNALEKSRMEKNESIGKRKREQKDKIQSILEQAKQSIGACSTVIDQNGDRERYKKLQGDGESKGYYQKYREANAQDTFIGSEIAYDLEKSEPVSLKAMSMLDAFNQATTSLRNELYVNEFALTKFNYRTYGLEKDPAGKPKKSNELVDPGSHALANQEVEYLLYGFSSCLANISSAYAEMFAFRLAIRTVEALLDPKKELLNIGSPLLVFLAAAAEGAFEAFKDMNNLIKGESVELSAKITMSAMSLSYKDYLRIFLLLHSNNTKVMARMQALIEMQTGKDLLLQTTYMQANASTSIRLWFVPKIMKLMEGTGLLGCKVQGNRCKLTSTAAVAY